MSKPIKRLFVHIGHAKTGTTAIQRTFAAARDSLRATGVLYPENNNHIYVVTRFHQDPVRMQPHRLRGRDAESVAQATARPWELLVADLAENRFETCLISSENFTNFDADACRRLASFCHDVAEEVRVVVYVRHPVSFVNSWVQELVKNGRAPLGELTERLPYFRFSKRLPGFVDAFGLENVIVRPFERDRLVGGDSVADLCHVLGIDPLPPIEGEAGINERISMPAIMIADALIGHLPQSEIVKLKPILNQIEGPRFQLPPAAAAAVRKKSRRDLAYLKQTFDIELTDPGAVGANFDEGNVFTPDALASIAALLMRLVQSDARPEPDKEAATGNPDPGPAKRRAIEPVS